MRILLSTASFALIVQAATPAAAQCQPGWAPGFGAPGSDSPVNELAVLDWGEGPRLVAVGYFHNIGGIDAVVAAWDGLRWTPFATTLANSSGIASLQAVGFLDEWSGPAVFVGGSFNSIEGNRRHQRRRRHRRVRHRAVRRVTRSVG